MSRICNESDLYRIIGENIKYYRQLYNLGKKNKDKMTQERLAEAAEVSVSLIGNAESEKIVQGISVYTLYKISCALNVDIGKFFINQKGCSE